MATTPPEKNTQPPATPGFAAALFGGLFSTAKKKPRIVDSRTAPMASVTRSSKIHHRRPEISLQSPSANELATTDKVVTTSAIDLLDTDLPSASPEAQMENSKELPPKSPWKSPSVPNMNGSTTLSLQFSVGNLKAPPSDRRSSLSQKSQTINRRRYRPSALLVPARRRKTGPINPVNAVNALQNSQNLFRPSDKQAEARNNYTSFRAGKRLLGSSQRGGSRLGPPVDKEERPPSPVEPATKRRKQVMFGDAVDATPIESEVATPKRPPLQKRKGTPFNGRAEVNASLDQAQTPVSSHKPHIESRPSTKLLLEKGNRNFEDPGEAKPLGSPVASRTPLFLKNPSFTLTLPKDLTPTRSARRFKDEVTKPSFEETNKPETIDTARPTSATKRKVVTNTPAQPGGWGDLFADQKTKWKCHVCSVQNEQSATKCPACETPRAGHDSKAAASTADEALLSKSSIGTSGFSFGSGSAVPATSSGGFTFGSQPSQAKSLPSKESGFSFASATSSTSKAQGFTFGTAQTSTTTGTGFTFGARTTSSSADTTSSGAGFKFDAPAPATVGGGTTGSGGLSFSTSPAKATEIEKPSTSTGTSSSTLFPASVSAPAPAPSSFGNSNKGLSENEANKTVLNFGHASTSNEENENKKPALFSFAPSAPAPGVGNGVAMPFKFSVPNDEKKSEDAPIAKPNFAFNSSTPSSPKKTNLPIPGIQSSEKTAPPANGASLTFPVQDNNKSDVHAESGNKPVFSFGNSEVTATKPGTGFSFGGTPAPRTSAEATTATTFSFMAPSASSTESKGLVPLGSIVNNEEADDDRSKRRRAMDNDVASSAPTFGGTTSNVTQVPTPAFTFGGSAPAPSTFGSQPQSDTSGTTFGSNVPPNPTGGFSFGAAPAPSSSSTFKFGDPSSSSAPKFGSESTSTEKSSAPLFGQSAPGTAPVFGGSQAAVPSFGNAAPAPASTSNPFSTASTTSSFSFGSAPASSFGPTTAPAASFGSAPAPAPTGTFGSTPAQSTAPLFGSTPAPAPMFGSTPAPAPMFGNTPGSSLPQFGSAPTSGPGFGVAPAPAPQGFGATSFGSTPAGASFGSTAPSSSGFGSAPPFGATPGPFGSVPGNFGGATPAQQSFGFGGAESGPGGFVSPAGGFGSQGGFSTPGTEQVQFNIGTGGTSKTTRGRRPLLRAKRPTSGR